MLVSLFIYLLWLNDILQNYWTGSQNYPHIPKKGYNFGKVSNNVLINPDPKITHF